MQDAFDILGPTCVRVLLFYVGISQSLININKLIIICIKKMLHCDIVFVIFDHISPPNLL